MKGQLTPYSRVIVGMIFGVLLLASTSQAFMWQGFEITPRASVREGYDDNVTYTKDNPIHDSITNLLFGAGVKQEGHTHSLAVDFNVAHQFFAQNISFNNTAEDVTVRLSKELSKYDQVKVIDTFSHAEEPRSFEDAFGRTSGRYFTYHNVFGLGYRRDLNEQIAWNLRYTNDTNDYSRKDMSDSSLNTVGTAVDYAFDSATIISPSYDYMYRDFSPGPSATENELAVNLRRFFTSQLYLDLQGGVDFFDSYGGQSYTKPMFRAALTNDIDETTQGGITFEKKYSTTSYTQDLLDSWRVSLKLAKQLTARFQAMASAFYGKGTYVATDQKDNLTGVNIGGSYELTRKAKLNLNYLYAQDDSTETSNSYIKNAVYLGITVEF